MVKRGLTPPKRKKEKFFSFRKRKEGRKPKKSNTIRVNQKKPQLVSGHRVLIRVGGKLSLTFGTVFTAPSGQTHFVAVWFRTGVMTEFVVSRTAQIGASVSVIMFVAFDAVTVIQRVQIVRTGVRIRFPCVRRIHPSLCGHLHH